MLELLTVAAVLGGGLLILAEFLDLFEIETRDLVVKQQAGGPHHAYAMLVVGAATIGAALLARSTEQWPPALGIALLGGFALLFALIVDLPDATRSDLVRGAPDRARPTRRWASGRSWWEPSSRSRAGSRSCACSARSTIPDEARGEETSKYGTERRHWSPGRR